MGGTGWDGGACPSAQDSPGVSVFPVPMLPRRAQPSRGPGLPLIREGVCDARPGMPGTAGGLGASGPSGCEAIRMQSHRYHLAVSAGTNVTVTGHQCRDREGRSASHRGAVCWSPRPVKAVPCSPTRGISREGRALCTGGGPRRLRSDASTSMGGGMGVSERQRPGGPGAQPRIPTSLCACE